jgi:RNA polymerase sigma-70 factor, ECF subfamily
MICSDATFGDIACGRYLQRDPERRLHHHTFDGPYLERLQEGEPETERHFCLYFGELILLKVCARGLSAHLDDIRQETFLRVLRTLRSPGGLRDAGALGAFVSTVCTHVMLEAGRSRKRDGVAPIDEPDALPDPSMSTAEARLISEERQCAVRRVIESLPPRERDLLSAIFLEERDKDHVCAEMGVTRDYLRVLVYRAKSQFKARCESDGVAFHACLRPPIPHDCV